MNIAIFSKIWPGAVEELKSKHTCSISINPETKEKHKLIEDAELVILRSPVKLDQETLNKAKNLKLILRAGMGLDAIDVDYAKEKGIKVVIVPLSAEAVAEHTFGLIFSLCRRMPWFHESLKEGRWEKHSGFGHDLFGKKLGLIGFGRIGIRTAEIAKAFNMKLYAYDRSPEKPHKAKAAKDLGVSFVGIDELFKVSDIISIQTPLNDSTRNLASRERIALMKSTAFITNVGRGKILDEDALYVALKEGRIGGAALDVFATEPPINSPLLTLPNFVGTPHVGAQTVDAQKKIGDDVLTIVEDYTKGVKFSEGIEV